MNELTKEMGWDVEMTLGDLPLSGPDVLFSTLFTYAVKIDGKEYPSSTLMNMCNCFNRMIRQASDIWSLMGRLISLHKISISTSTLLLQRLKWFYKQRVHKRG